MRKVLSAFICHVFVHSRTLERAPLIFNSTVHFFASKYSIKPANNNKSVSKGRRQSRHALRHAWRASKVFILLLRSMTNCKVQGCFCLIDGGKFSESQKIFSGKLT